jgi:glutamine amidotransferase
VTALVHIVDYGIGNLYSVARAIEKAGGEARVTSDHRQIAKADRLILPGVGAFRNGMQGLRAAGVEDAVLAFARSGRPLLGICLGMQMFADRSVEFGEHAGLGLIGGQVQPIPPLGAAGAQHKVPFIGWAELEPARETGLRDTPLRVLRPGSSVYLVHSFHFVPERSSDLLAVYNYDGVPITAAVARDNIVGCQFHPEKSGRVGIRIIAEFLAR